MSVAISIDIPKTSYFGGERVEGTLIVKATGTVRIPGIVVNAGSLTSLERGSSDDEANHASIARVAEPYKQQLRVAMPKNGEKDIVLGAGSTASYPFALILPPDLFPSYYCAAAQEDGTTVVASLSYHLAGDVANQCGVSVESTPTQIQIVPVALPYGPQPRKGYIIDVFDGLDESSKHHQDSDGEYPEEEDHQQSSEDGTSAGDSQPYGGESAKEKKKTSMGCMGGGKKNKEDKAGSSVAGNGKAGKPTKANVVRAGMVKASLTMQTAYVCLPLNDEDSKLDKYAVGTNTLWVEVKLSNQMYTAELPFEMRLALKLVVTFKPTNGDEPVVHVVTLASRRAKAVLPGSTDGETLLLKPGESTPMRLSLTIPQRLALARCEALPVMAPDGSPASRRAVSGPVPPTVETTTLDVRTILEVSFTSLDGKTRNDEHVIVLEDPVEIVGVPSGE